MNSRALFLDRDGVINRDSGYVHRPTEIHWIEGIFPLCRAARARGYKLIVVTNQSGIARGLYTQADFDALMVWMRVEFTAQQAPLDAVYSCPYHPVHGIGLYKREHVDRKPGPGMILRAARDLSLDIAGSVLIGDRCSDIAAAHAAGIGQAFLLKGTEPGPCPHPYTPIDSLADVFPFLDPGTSPAV